MSNVADYQKKGKACQLEFRSEYPGVVYLSRINNEEHWLEVSIELNQFLRWTHVTDAPEEINIRLKALKQQMRAVAKGIQALQSRILTLRVAHADKPLEAPKDWGLDGSEYRDPAQWASDVSMWVKQYMLAELEKRSLAHRQEQENERYSERARSDIHSAGLL